MHTLYPLLSPLVNTEGKKIVDAGSVPWNLEI